jgi:hypothetical protein
VFKNERKPPKYLINDTLNRLLLLDGTNLAISKTCRDAVVVVAAAGDATFSYVYGEVLHVSNFTQDFTKDKLNEALETNEFIRRVKKMRDSSFVHFENSVNAMQAMEAVDGRMIYGANIQVLL